MRIFFSNYINVDTSNLDIMILEVITLITKYKIHMDSYSFVTNQEDYQQSGETILIDAFKKLETAEWCFDCIPTPEGYHKVNTPLPKEYSHDLIIYSLLEFSTSVSELKFIYFVKTKE